jgi:hypothetical protein
MPITDNTEIAILTKLNELAERFGLTPCDFVATVQGDKELHFEIPAQGNMLRQARFEKMLRLIGVNDEGIMTGTRADIWSTLNEAVRNSPKPPQRF